MWSLSFSFWTCFGQKQSLMNMFRSIEGKKCLVKAETFSPLSSSTFTSVHLLQVFNKSHLLSAWLLCRAVLPPSYSSVSQAPVDNPFSPPCSALSSSSTPSPNPPTSPDPHPKTARWDPVSVPQKDPSLWNMWGIVRNVVQRAQFQCLGFSQ